MRRIMSITKKTGKQKPADGLLCKDTLLQKDCELYRRVIENISDGISIIDLFGHFLYVSPSHMNLGYSPQDLIGKSATEYMHPQDRDQFFPMLVKYSKKIIARGPRTIGGIKKEIASIRINLRFRNPVGGWYYIESSPTVIKNPFGMGYAILLISRNVTERKKAEQEMEELSYQNILMLNSVVEGILRLDVQRNIVFANQAALNILGYTYRELIGQPFTKICRYTGLKPFLQQDTLFASLAGGTCNKAVSELFWKRNGKSLTVEYIGVPLIDGEKKIGSVITFKDVSEKKSAEEDLLKYKFCLEHIHDAVFITKVDSTIVYVNSAFEKLYGYPREYAVGRKPNILKSGAIPQEQYARMWKMLLDKKPIVGEVMNKAKDGRIIRIDGSINPILDSRGNLIGFLAIQRDKDALISWTNDSKK